MAAKEKVARECSGDLEMILQLRGELESPIKGDAGAVRMCVAEFGVVSCRAECFISSPCGGVSGEVTIFDGDSHVFIEHKAQPRKGLPRENQIGITSVKSNIIYLEMVHIQN